MSNLKIELSGMRYGDLKAKFEELGIAEAWKSGIKKDVLIRTAVDLIEKRDLLNDKVTDDDKGVEEDKTIETNELQDHVSEDLVSVEKENTKLFNIEVEVIVSKKEFWTKEALEKRIVVLGAVFAQHREVSKGKEALKKQEILIKALEIMF